ncbi:MAG: alpha/beta hydrolase [Synergistaceae bacterium]|nr:alpha/beta hydrolase [Synergistaceae bacterium]
MKKETIKIENIPAILWGEKSDSVYIYVHGKLSNKEETRGFAEKAVPKGYQVLSFDLPKHGDRTDENYPCMPWNGVRDLNIIGGYAERNWSGICLYGSSLGAYFSLLAYTHKIFPLGKCLFLSPVLDMERLIRNMMEWSGVNEQELEEKREIATPMGETLYWDYYCYARENPIGKWNVPTAILYGSDDDLTERWVVERFAERFSCDLTVLEGSGHWFHTERQLAFLDEWIERHVSPL